MIGRLDRLPRRRDDVLLHDDDTRSVLAVPDQDVTHVLNPTARAVWEMCDGTTTLDELADAICEVFSVSRTEAVIDVAAVIEQLVAADLVVWAGPRRKVC
jgi:hypothetical protein